jgi:hypothetical protein
MKLFELRRDEDETGVSGTGVVAQGVIFDNGRCSMTWLTDHTSTAVYESIDDVKAIHGHQGKTRVVEVWDHDPKRWRGLVTNAAQDDIEGVVHSFIGDHNREAVWRERQLLARLFNSEVEL